MNAIVTVAIGETYNRMKQLTHPSIESYAKRIGVDFICIDKSNCTTPHWGKFQIYNLLNKYEHILYLDTDIIVRSDCPDLFKIVPEGQLGMFNEMSFTSQRHLSLIDSCKEYGILLKNWNGKYYNTGVMIIPRRWRFLFKKPDKEYFSFYEQGYLNARIHQELDKIGNEMQVFELPYKFNRMTCMDQFTGEERYASYIIHYAGYPSLEFVLSLIRKDVSVWSRNSYHYKRHILIDVQGGLGDQVEAQPAIRYLINNIYKDEDINIKTHYPLLFEDIGAKVCEHGEWKREDDVPYYHVNTLPGPETVMWTCVSNLLCHTVDYCSMALLRRTLPHKDKRIYLKVKDEWVKEAREVCGEDLENLIIVHAGKHWESKTFPIEWWQDIIDGLQKEGKKVCLIGKNELTRGVLPLNVRKGMIDARDLLSLEALVALLSKAKILLSNDSAPVHLAGAFDNWIILIPSCKHPDHILPWRNGQQYYKAKALYKHLTLDEIPQAPTETINGGSTAEYVVGNILDYLPKAKEVINTIIEVFKKE